MAETDEKLTPVQIAHKAADLILEKKGEELLVVDITECSDIADYLVIACGSNKRQVQAMCAEIRQELKKAGHLPLSITGEAFGWWILIDYGDVIIHLMQEEARRFYDLDALWADGRVVRRAAGPSDD